MSWEFINIGHYYSFILFPAGPADSFAFRYSRASGMALEAIKNQLIFLDDVVTDPPPIEFCF